MNFWPTNISNLMPLKHISLMNPEQIPESTAPDFEFEYIDIGNVSLADGIAEMQRMRFESSPSRARKKVMPGDTIISTVRTYLKAVAFIEKKHHSAIASTGFAVLRPKEGINPKFLYRAVQSDSFVESVSSFSTGVSYPAINPSTLGGIKLPVPEPYKQKEIADFLEWEIIRIDNLIKKKEKFISLVQEKKHSLSNQLLNGAMIGLDQSGISGWFGDLPSNWQALRAKFLFGEAQGKSEAGDEELLTVSHITGVTKRSEKDVNMFMAETMEGYKLVSRSDVVVNTMWAWMGAMGVSPHEGLISPAYGVYRPLRNSFQDDYLDLIIRSKAFIAEATRGSKGIHSSRLRLYPDAFLDILFPVPSLNEQKKIMEEYSRVTSKENKLVELNTKSIELLKEFRSSLITEAVTGQLDIQTWKKKEARISA